MVTIARNARLTEDRQVIHFCVYTIIPELFKSHTFEIDELAIKILIEFTKTCKGIVSFTDEYFKSIYLNLNPALRNQKGYCALYLDELCIAIVGMNIYNYHKYKLTEEESTSSKVIPL
uniref:Histone acetyltransferase n=1 Tax=Rhabditophanes sp. KR3021 TaxID=114890 RepID=A0AC35TRB1_9BILA